jgi:hypothetical protein
VNWLETAAPITLALTFALAGANKLRDPHGFTMGVLDYEILPRPAARVFARVLPFAELGVAIGLLIGGAPVLSGLAASILLIGFLVAVSVNLVRGRTIDCHCFGARVGEAIGLVTVVRLLVLLICALVVLRSTVSSLIGPEPLGSAFAALGLALCLYLLGPLPTAMRLMRTKPVTAPTRHGGRVSFRNVPLLPIAIVMKDRSHEMSRCGACP